jgi:FkbM family methyltransferase
MPRPRRMGAAGRVAVADSPTRLHSPGMVQLRFLFDRLRGRETVVGVRLLGRPFRVAIASPRELRRVRSLAGEAELLGRMCEHLLPGDTVYDVGANVGLMSLVLGSRPLAPAVRVHSFEPEPANFRQLGRNIELNGLADRVVPHRLALGAVDGEGELFVRGGPGEGRHSLASSTGSTGSIRVPLVTLASFARSVGDPPDFLKIDVEGAEGQVLAGMTPLLDQGRPRELFIEIHPKGDGDRMPGGGTIADWLVDRGYAKVWESRAGSRLQQHYR